MLCTRARTSRRSKRREQIHRICADPVNALPRGSRRAPIRFKLESQDAGSRAVVEKLRLALLPLAPSDAG
jgi:hypothetical protein